MKTVKKPTRQVNDGLIKGIIQESQRRCDHCQTPTIVIKITDVNMEEIDPCKNMILFSDQSNWDADDDELELYFIQHIGIGCGCYGRMNRQMAYIKMQQRK